MTQRAQVEQAQRLNPGIEFRQGNMLGLDHASLNVLVVELAGEDIWGSNTWVAPCRPTRLAVGPKEPRALLGIMLRLDFVHGERPLEMGEIQRAAFDGFDDLHPSCPAEHSGPPGSSFRVRQFFEIR